MRKSPANAKRVLLTFVGSHDPWRGGDAPSGYGPVLSLLEAETFDAVHLFHNNDEYLRRASALMTEARRRWPDIEVTYENIPAPDPTNHDLLYELMHNRCVELAAKSGNTAQFTVATSSGTPQMQTCWLLLVLGGVLKARLVQLVPPHKLRPGDSPVREIKPSLERFPKIVSPARLQRELSAAKHQVEILTQERESLARQTATGLVGDSLAFRRAVEQAKRFARFDLPVLLLGETGTGKEEFAKLIHFSSSRREKPFLAFNCACLPETVADSELFGHTRGAFTGAVDQKPGLFETAGEGTVLLDEIGDLPPAVQAKLLRVLEDGSYQPLGATRPKKSAARVIAATHKPLSDMVAEKTFREDLYYRLNRAEVLLPPLRDRRQDIPALAQHFLNKFCAGHGLELKLSPEVLEALKQADWPGNVRELKSKIEMMAIVADKPLIELADIALPSKSAPKLVSSVIAAVGDQPLNLPEIMAHWEKDMMEQAIKRFQNNRSAAARHLGFEEATFRKKCRKYFGRKT